MSTSLSLPSQEAALALIVGLVLMLLVRFCSSTRRSNIVRRAAFDIGSGASKVLVADVDRSGMLVGATLWEAEKPCAFKEDTQGTVDGTLSEGIRSKGMALITELAKKARKLGATEACGIATRGAGARSPLDPGRTNCSGGEREACRLRRASSGLAARSACS